MKKKFYVCSYGGSGSKMLCSYLMNFGKVWHIHSRRPPNKLTNIGTIDNSEWFNNQILDEQSRSETKVLFIYRNPVDAILSRFYGSKHLRNIQTDPNITMDDVVKRKKDLYGITEFFDNYTKLDNKNYDIYCIKYEDFFDKIEELNELLGLSPTPNMYPIQRETKYLWGTTKSKRYDLVEPLKEVYAELIQEMEDMPFIKINKRD